jgi:predicted dehydrogenase
VSKKILIIGKGSAGCNHYRILKSNFKKSSIKTVSSRKLNVFKNKKLLDEIISFDPKYIILCAPSSIHYKYINKIENLFLGINVLIEKPLFNKYYRTSKNYNNNYFIGFNLRFHPVIKFIKKFIVKKNIIFININSSSYLPNWRKGKNYKKTVSAQKNLGGGVLLELSHEIDLLRWMFKKIKIINVFNKKISKLRIDCDDILSAQGLINDKIYFNLNLNFFSRNDQRKIQIDGDKFSIDGDLLENKINIFEKKRKIIKFNNYNMKRSYFDQYKDFFQSKKIICSFENAIKTQRLIKQITDKK